MVDVGGGWHWDKLGGVVVRTESLSVIDRSCWLCDWTAMALATTICPRNTQAAGLAKKGLMSTMEGELFMIPPGEIANVLSELNPSSPREKKTESAFSSFLILRFIFPREVSLNSVEQNDEDANIRWFQFCIYTSSYISRLQQ
ncbi:hypothetical protein V6N13_095631 [Hibiscus sabdariffa]